MKKIVVCILLFLIFINVKADENIFPITEKHTFEMGDESILVSIDNNYNLNFIGNNLKNSKKCSIIFKFYDDSKNLITEEYYTSDIIKNSYTNSIRRNAEFTPFYYNASFDCSDLYSYTTPSNYNYTKPSNYHSNDNDELSSEEFLISVVILIIISATTVIFAEKVRKK